jgi:hypothetical protein
VGDSKPSLPGTDLLFLPMQLAAQALAAVRLAPEVLGQAINPGWSSVVNINSNNSAAPETERAVLTKYSYGRQLGRLIDVVELLVKDLEERQPDRSKAESVAKFRALENDIAEVKNCAAARRVDRIVADVEALSRSDDAEFRELKERLRKVLGG